LVIAYWAYEGPIYRVHQQHLSRKHNHWTNGRL
jgi:hypothetical protein